MRPLLRAYGGSAGQECAADVAATGEDEAMHLTPREFDKLVILSVAQIAAARKGRGLKLNHPEAVAMVAAAALEGAREGRTLEEVMHAARHVLTRNDVMEGVADMMPIIQVEAVFTDGSRLVTVHSPIQ
jgi:urease subunit gamma